MSRVTFRGRYGPGCDGLVVGCADTLARCLESLGMHRLAAWWVAGVVRLVNAW